MKILIFYSGGKDSQAALIHSVKKYGVNNCEAVFCDTGHENPQTYEHIKTTIDQLGVKLVTLKSEKYDSLFDLAKKKKRFPSTKARFCTEELKIKPAIDYILSLDESIIVIEGIRKDESLIRSKMEPECMYFRYYFEPYGYDKNGKEKKHSYRAKDVLEWCKKHDASKLRPIFTWTAEQTLNYIKDNGQLPNPLYYQGFSRVGCFPCIMATKSEVKLIIQNHPEQWKAIKEAEKDSKGTFFKPDYIPNYAKFTRDKKGNQIATAEDVEKYLTASSAQIDLFEKPIGCMSVYNLCE